MSMRMRFTVLSVLLSAAACQPHYDGLEIRYITSNGDFSDDGLVIAEGDAVAFQVKPLSDSPYEDYEKFDLVELEPFHESVIEIFESTDVDLFVAIGRKVGNSAVRVRINDREVDIIDATVEAQVPQ
jgi:hypothetical protein